MYDAEDSPVTDLKPTDLDLIRLEEAELGERIEGEMGTWTVFKYKDGYTLMVNRLTDNFKEFKSLKELVFYLGRGRNKNFL